MINWSQIEEHVSQLPHQQDVRVPKESVVHPQGVGIGYSWFAYRKALPNGRAIDIKPYADCYLAHWDWHNPATDLILHALDDAPGEWLLATTLTGAAIGAMSSEKDKRGKGALVGASIGLGVGLLALLLRAIAAKN